MITNQICKFVVTSIISPIIRKGKKSSKKKLKINFHFFYFNHPKGSLYLQENHLDYCGILLIMIEDIAMVNILMDLTTHCTDKKDVMNNGDIELKGNQKQPVL